MLFLLALRLSLCSRKLSFVFVFSKHVFALFFCAFPYFYFFVGSWFLSVSPASFCMSCTVVFSSDACAAWVDVGRWRNKLYHAVLSYILMFLLRRLAFIIAMAFIKLAKKSRMDNLP